MKLRILTLVLAVLCTLQANAGVMTNVYGRQVVSLNGRWDAIIDPYDQGVPKKIFDNRTAQTPTEFFEYAWEGGLRLNVPSDWNSQDPRLQYYEGTLWYARHFDFTQDDLRHFLHFGGVSLRCSVYLNGQLLCSHEGGFTPFEVEVTDALREGDNFLCVMVNNTRRKEAIPSLSFDWWNYGGIIRDVHLVSVPEVYVNQYFVRLEKGSKDVVLASVELSKAASQEIVVEIPALKVKAKTVTDDSGHAELRFKAPKLSLWSPESPALYTVVVTSGSDSVTEEIGFRNIETQGTKILINGKPVFMKGVNFHEEIPQRMGRAFSRADAAMILSEVKALGANMIRTAHYPQNEYIVREAERLGLVIWEEIPLWQGIDFEQEWTLQTAKQMLREMIERDRNRCAICFWSIANETRPSPVRDAFLTELLGYGRSIDTSRLFTAAFDDVYYVKENNRMEMEDDFADLLDVVGVNKYMGWYAPWPNEPGNLAWHVKTTKPLIITEFGCEALYGQSGDPRWASSWSEDYQEQLFKDNILMFEGIENLAGTLPWVLFDFRSPYRFHPTNQEGWNRKGLLSDQGERKKAWYVLFEYYKTK